MRLTAPCKINLYLRIGAKRPDGYHDIRTLFYPLSAPCDELVVEPAEGGGLALTCSDPALEGGDNLVARAWRAYGERTGFRPGLRVHLVKRAPHGMGLGGGSSDAAALLRYLNARAGTLALGEAALFELAAGLGADVPFFLLGAAAWAEGIGERLTPVACDLGDFSLLLVCPGVRVSTAWAYGEFDRLAASSAKLQSNFLTWGCVRSTQGDCGTLLVIANDFEPAVFQEFPELRRIKEQLLCSGAAAAALSGSGAGLFGLFRDRSRALAAAGVLRGQGLRVYAPRLAASRA
ncbi:MAG: 4-(cytidine 5'-diphospho)-2-C-methyl-D-erythritol kinase [Desulfovibrionaceae bacterium]|nr:4-(cytidine 5'-diphospho)-2-C-methyl-D-erythritol kinase [Desulfovibrionaceae bacterium]MBF0513876.1 4-(cytidine 5'-diphospho)-2-C-methyl-D-erythritol kinase [Desulfovibrionaceae bacterium]